MVYVGVNKVCTVFLVRKCEGMGEWVVVVVEKVDILEGRHALRRFGSSLDNYS